MDEVRCCHFVVLESQFLPSTDRDAKEHIDQLKVFVVHYYWRVALYQHSKRSAHGTGLSPRPFVCLSVCVSGKCIVAKRLIGSGCYLGW